jgi:pimeloyl-ACP methyl ester carboxylesterase
MHWTLPESFDTGDGLIRWACLGHGEPIVLTHGTPFSSFIWRDIAPALAIRRRVFVWDLLGYGQSDKHQGQNVSLARQGQLLARLVEHWELDRPSLVGHDFGGAITLRAHLLEQLPARDLTLIDAVSCGTWGTGLFLLTKNDIDTFRQLPAYAHEALVASHIRTASHTGLTPAVLDTYVSAWRGAEGQAAYYRQIDQARQAHTDEFQHLLAAITVPVRILWGRQDTWLPGHFADLLRERIPQASFSWIDDAGHLVHEDAPAVLTAHLLSQDH